MEKSKTDKKPEFHTLEQGIILQNVALFLADNRKLIDNVNVELVQGDRLLIQGKSGCGKTSLLRLLAGLWRFDATGVVKLPPKQQMMFVPQRPYLPQGTLKQAICYPKFLQDNNQEIYDNELTKILQYCKLDYLSDKLHEQDNWQQRLSSGELQRIAFVRMLLAKPQVLLLDEVTSALDELTEAYLYQLLIKTLPQTLIISIGHRQTLTAFHHRVLRLDEYAILTIFDK